MIHFDMPPNKSNIIKVLGFGGGGGNAVNFMFTQNIQNVDFIVCNTDAQALESSRVPNKIQLGPNLTSGLGAGANPNVGKEATEESLEEIRRMLETNTKMAFITAGMGGGTGTGGAPIVAKICRELGILTVGIVTTPFSYEGPRRMAQAQEGVNELKKHVDTLLVISNDKLRHQFGNLKMREAFAKADDVLCTAARCITDVINTAGQINVDFSDVCTVMRNGGVAILGSAQVGGENRALEAIEAAANSPLLNDNDIAGAKWILLNISSSAGEHECTMDEVDLINQYLVEQTGGKTDVIFGLTYDDSLGDKIGITLIATGFHHKDPFTRQEPVKPAEKPIVMTLGVAGDEKKMENAAQQPMPTAANLPEATQLIMPLLTEKEPEKPAMPTLFDNIISVQAPAPVIGETDEAPVVFELSTDTGSDGVDTSVVSTMVPEPPMAKEVPASHPQRELFDFLQKPASIYNQAADLPLPQETAPKPAPSDEAWMPVLNEADDTTESLKLEEGISLSFEEDNVSANPITSRPVMTLGDSTQEELSEEAQQKRRAMERIQRLRNLSYNGGMDGSGLDDVPAYMRSNLDLHNRLANVEDFYSRATVRPDDQNKGPIGTLNTFLHGERPD
jgi:cell division protein FtsZ